MSKTIEKLKGLLDDHHKTIVNTNDKNKVQLEQRITSVFLFGFIIGIIFSYTSIIGFMAGFLTGVVVRNNLSKRTHDFIENIINIFFGIFNNIKNSLNIT